MPNTYTPAGAQPPTSYTNPSDGDKMRMATSLAVVLQALEDGIKWLTDGNTPSTNYSRVQAFNPQMTDGTTHIFAVAGTHVQQLATGGGFIVELDIPQNASVTAVTLHLQGAGGHAALPGTMPSFEFKKVDIYTGTATSLIGPTSDTSANTTAYQTIHTISLTNAGISISRGTQRYFCIVGGEGGTNFVAGLKYYGVNVDYTMTSRDGGAA